MDNIENPFKGASKISKLSILTKFKYVELLSDFLEFYEASTSAYEVDITTHVDPYPEDKWQVEAYFFDLKEKQEVIEGTKNYINELKIEAEILNFEEVPDIDWVSEVQKNIPPIIIPPFVISSEEMNDNREKYHIKISAGRAFGTGSHETTAACIEALSKLIENNTFKNILDIGTGSGILAIAASKIFNSNITATDLDNVAIEVAKENFKLNNISNIKAFACDGFKDAQIKHNKYDLVFANILAQPLIDMAEDAANVLADDGYIILSGFLLNQEKMVFEKYSYFGLKLFDRIINGDWVCLILQKAS
ncbi:MAG: 50S ribosomal protein L11 methyltransferase [Sphingobacteriia bacterium]|nr:50S ribosomal protein L11 methyltransferase [Sphingobacteriia bacterium]